MIPNVKLIVPMTMGFGLDISMRRIEQVQFIKTMLPPYALPVSGSPPLPVRADSILSTPRQTLKQLTGDEKEEILEHNGIKSFLRQVENL